MKRFLTPEEQNAIDPTGEGRKFLRGFKDGAPTPVPYLFTVWSRDQWFSKFCELRTKTFASASKYSFELDFDLAHDSKFGPQGDSFSLSELVSKYDKSYKLAKRTVALSDWLYIARDYFLREICEAKSRTGGILYPTGIGSVNTLAGLPTMRRKGSFVAECIGTKMWQHPYHDLPGQRSQRLKHRGINVDSVLNVRAIERPLTAVRNWLKMNFPQYFSAWLNPNLELNPRIYAGLSARACAVEVDYDDCDDSFSWEIAEFLLPIYEALLDEGEYWHFAAMVKELFWQPVFFGDFEYCGKHNLLSGQAITNDFETLFDVLCMIATILMLNLRDKTRLLAALGDDVLMLIEPSSKAHTDKVLETYTDLASSAGMMVSPTKSSARVNFGQACFLRRAYTVRQKVHYNENGLPYISGWYPSVLTLNNIINPEYHSGSTADVIVSTCSRLDNLFGSIMFTPLTQFVVAHRKRSVAIPTLSELQSVDYRDWWQKLYGEPFSLKSSHSFPILSSMLHITE